MCFRQWLASSTSGCSNRTREARGPQPVSALSIKSNQLSSLRAAPARRDVKRVPPLDFKSHVSRAMPFRSLFEVIRGRPARMISSGEVPGASSSPRSCRSDSRTMRMQSRRIFVSPFIPRRAQGDRIPERYDVTRRKEAAKRETPLISPSSAARALLNAVPAL